jgi:multiple sugar transport system substrate-binding protein
MASSDLPDVAYLNTALALQWAEEGRIMDLTDEMDQFPELANRLPEAYLYYEPGKIAGNTTAVETIQLYYMRDILEEYGVNPPPSNAEEAWTWDEFVEAAQMLTIDRNGNNALHPDFDPGAIEQYGVSMPNWYMPWHALLINNDADFTNEDGTEFTLNEPEALEVLQAIRDLIHEHHVAPSPTAQADMPATSVALQTGRVAMAINGQWMINTFAADDLDFGIGVTPVFQEGKRSRATIESGASVIFADTEHPQEALEFYLYHNDPEKVGLFQSGLWMPIEEKYYTDPERMDIWLHDDVHPPEYPEAVIDFALDAVPSPVLSMKNWVEIESEIQSGLENVWLGDQDVLEAVEELETIVQPMLEGRYERE